MLQVNLNGKWKMKRMDQAQWMDAAVPGSVYNDLLNAGIIDDPFYHDNEYRIMELCSYDYEYIKSFSIHEEIIRQDNVLLYCEGLDTIAQIYLNGQHIADTVNMHRTYEFDVKSYLKPGENELHLIFRSPLEYVKRRQKEYPLINSSDAVEGISHLRKAHCMFGWDWGPKLPDMGIWRSISIKAFSSARIEDVYISQRHENSQVILDIRTVIEKWSTCPVDILVKVTAPTGESIKRQASLNNTEERFYIQIGNPQLWWPNNFGSQPLYTVNIVLLKEGQPLDELTRRIGLRTLTVRQQKDEWGESFEFAVNGTAIFAMGADYIPEDNILARCNRERTEKLVKSCVDANFNSIRVWGGGIYPEDYFYDLCDEYGLVVWQDLMYACGVYDLNDEFKENITQEAIDNMKRLRHHASLGLLCGNNEQEWGWVEWGWSGQCSSKLKDDYVKQFEVLLPEIAAKTAPDTFYWYASPSSAGGFYNPNDENYGDMHYWGVWHGKEPYTAYRKHFPRFMSEFGLQSFPGMKTIESFTLPEDRNVFSYVMESHQKNGTGNEKILYYISENYKYPKDLDSLVYTSQLVQADGMRYGVEHWRRNRGRCMGAIYWQLNDCWPVASWSSIDSFGRYKALHYAAKRFFAPVLLSACEEGANVSLHITNETTSEVSGTLKWSLMDAKSHAICSSEKEVNVAALSSKELYTLDFSDKLDSVEVKRSCYLEFTFLTGNEALSRGTVLFVKCKHFGFINPEIKINSYETENNFILEVISKAFAKFVELSLRDYDIVFSDNYFDLSAGEIRKISIRKDTMPARLSLEELQRQLKVRSLIDTY